MKDIDLMPPLGASCREQRLAGPIVRSARSIDTEVHDRLAEEVLKMRYLSRLRAFALPALRR